MNASGDLYGMFNSDLTVGFVVDDLAPENRVPKRSEEPVRESARGAEGDETCAATDTAHEGSASGRTE